MGDGERSLVKGLVAGWVIEEEEERMGESDERRAGEKVEEQQRQQRLAALRALAEETKPAAPAPASPATGAKVSSRLRQSSRPRWRSLLVGLAAVVVLSAGGVAAYRFTHRTSRPVTPPIPDTITLDLAKDHLGCPNTLAWSPDGARLAVMTKTGSCASPLSTAVTVLAIYDARTGKLLRRFQPDSLLATLAGTGRAANAEWSPDGATLAVDAVIYPHTQDGQPSLGLLLVSAQQGTARLIQGPSYNPNALYPQVTWDVSNGQAIGAINQTAPPALTYRWTADGRIVPDQPLPSASLQDQLQAAQ
jgi:hypothetical protein